MHRKLVQVYGLVQKTVSTACIRCIPVGFKVRMRYHDYREGSQQREGPIPVPFLVLSPRTES
jgi:hypothetical protein